MEFSLCPFIVPQISFDFCIQLWLRLQLRSIAVCFLNEFTRREQIRQLTHVQYHWEGESIVRFLVGKMRNKRKKAGQWQWHICSIKRLFCRRAQKRALREQSWIQGNESLSRWVSTECQTPPTSKINVAKHIKKKKKIAGHWWAL